MNRLYWPSWALATATTGIVAGFFLGHALVLGRFLDWLIVSGRASALADTYPVFRQSAGSAALDTFYLLAALQVLAAIGFAATSTARRRGIGKGVIVAVSSVSWPLAHYGSGFGNIEASVLRSTSEVPRHLAEAFVAYNTPVHLFHVLALLVALGVLLAVPVMTDGTKD